MSAALSPSVTAFEWPVRVYYEDTDAAGVVYYANYLRFMERARSEWLRSFGIELPALEKSDGVLFVVTRAEIDYKSAARLGDTLTVSVAPVAAGAVFFTLAQPIRHSGDGRILTEARVTLACLDARRWRPARIPAALRARVLDGLAQAHA